MFITQQGLWITWFWIQGITLGVVYVHKILVPFDQLISRALCREMALLQLPLQLRHRQQVVHQLRHRTLGLAKGTMADVEGVILPVTADRGGLGSAVTFVRLIKTHTSNESSLLGNTWDLILAKHFLINDESVVLVLMKWEKKIKAVWQH